MTAPQKLGQSILFALLWQLNFAVNKVLPVLHYFKQNIKCLLAIWQEAIRTWKMIT